jgi:hypothetical protein
MGLLVGLLINQAAVYMAYFVFRYGIASLVTDKEALAIEEILDRRLFEAGYVSQLKPVRSSNSAVAGCSFLAFEELWRDCKSIYVQSGLVRRDGGYMEIINTTVRRPCEWLSVVPAGRRVDINLMLGCEGDRRIFRAKVYAMHGDLRVLAVEIDGEISN